VPHRRLQQSLLALAAIAITSLTLPAQSAQEILDRFSKAVDPAGKLTSLTGFRSEGTFEMPAAGMSATFVSMQRRPNQMAMSIMIGGLGEMKQGSDGSTVWSNDPMQGPRILTGAEAAAFLDGADFRAMARPAELFSAMERAGEAEVDGEKCLKVKLTWKSERVTTECFSVATGLLIETSGTQATPQGEVSTTGRITDYRSVGGVMMPHKIVNSMMGFQQILTITKAEAVEQDPALFELPPEIKALKKP